MIARLALALALTATLALASEQGASLDLTVSNERPAQGSAVLARCRPPAGAGLTAAFAGRAVRFYPSGREQVALVPVDLELAPGDRVLAVTANLPGGTCVEGKLTLRVRRGSFRIQRLRVEPRMVHPDAQSLARIEREQAQVEEALRPVTPRAFAGRFRRPVLGGETASFGGRRIFNGVPRSPHSGVDFRAGTGTLVESPAPGTVVLVADHYFAGKNVWLDHGLGVFSNYAHLSSVTVRAGQRVRAGEPLGRVGSTGRVTGPHLHWGARISGARVNPLDLTRLPL